MLAKYAYHPWRIVATGFCFFAFGLGGLLLWLVVLPLLGLVVRNQQRRQVFSRGVICRSFRLFVDLMRLLGILDYDARDLQRLKGGGHLVLANHPSLIDVVFLVAFVPDADCVVRGGLARNPFTRGPIRAAGYITNEDGPGLIHDCIRALERGGNLLIFPEGTRTPPSGEIRLQRGAANIAVRGRRAITPVIIHCHPRMLMKRQKWYQVPKQRTMFCFEVHPRISVDAYVPPALPESRGARELTRRLQRLFTQEAGHAGA